MAFNWDDYETEDQTPETQEKQPKESGFDFEQYESEGTPEHGPLAQMILGEYKAKPEPLPETTQSQAALDKFTEGATFGFSDELAGAFEAGGQAVGLKGLGGPVTDIEFTGDPTLDKQKLLEAYQRGREAQRAKQQAAEEQFPKTALAADIAGGLAMPGGVLKQAGKGALKLGGKQAAKQILKTGARKGAAAGAGIGALEGAGRTEEDVLSEEGLKDIAESSLYGGLLGGAIGKVGEKFTKAKMAKKAEELAEEADVAAQRSLGATDKEIAETVTEQVAGTSKGKGLQAIEEGIVDPLSRPKEVYRKAIEAKNAIKDGYETVINKFDNEVNLSGAQADDLAQQFHQKVVNEVNESLKTASDELTPAMTKKLGSDLERLQDDLFQALRSNNPIRDLQNLYVQYNKAFHNSRISPTGEARKSMRNVIKEIQRNLAETLEEGTKKEFNDLDRRYTNILDIEEMTAKATGKKQSLGLGDLIQGATARLTGIPLAGELVTGASIASKKLIGKGLEDVMGGAGAIRKSKQAKTLKEFAEGLGEETAEEAGTRIGKAYKEAEGPLKKTTTLLDEFKKQVSGRTRAGLEKEPGLAGAKAATVEEALTDESQAAEAPYKRNNRVIKVTVDATPEQLSEQANAIRNQHGEAGEKLAEKFDKMANSDKRQRTAQMFSILQDPRNRKMLGLME